MLANGPPWTSAGLPSSVCTRLGIRASRSSTAMAPGAFSACAVTAARSRVQPTIMRPRRASSSARLALRQNTAMTSEATVMSKPSSRGKPLATPPRLDTIERSARSFMSIDMNDRALRSIVSSLGGVANGFPREDGFDITVASEVMAVFCLSASLAELEARRGRMIVGWTRDRAAVTAQALKAPGAMAVLLRDALMPNLVQTLEGNPALVHGGPFANIAHGCNSVIATRTALRLADYVVTEAGFGADLGAEKFFDIKCRKAGLKPAAAVVVATVRALKMHGGVAKDTLGQENLKALEAGMANLARHVENIRKFGVPPIV